MPGKPRRKIRPARCPKDGAAVDLQVWISLPRGVGDAAHIMTIPKKKACRECYQIYDILPPKPVDLAKPMPKGALDDLKTKKEPMPESKKEWMAHLIGSHNWDELDVEDTEADVLEEEHAGDHRTNQRSLYHVH